MSSVIKINAITVPEDSGDQLGERFAARRDSMEGTPGFQGFELLQPTDGRTSWLVLTRWDSEEAFEDWRKSQSFGESHGHGEGGAPKKPVGMSSELWSYTVFTTG
ncbi:antibiotic biosynthesis monooxygenase family protein [Nesterenkonia natronophila]|uniref:Antibiotic biosynthesis monooxygenase n=1 Tax=Nesterenkonia natronophila TaxID=2174932 RepID=A0A3A4EZU5_9MICC|nr:antibiotic biosynthesis monooxygenase family protein [Nesterenkonia natronophila]RJN31422.1 antibiotic biosynthesis monooxygenase [Nesterenkonia natronophila]